MRLIYVEKRDGIRQFRFRDFIDDDFLPCYAILSHTWGEASTEVTYQDLLADSRPPSNRYNGIQKLEFCADRIEAAGLVYFWIDTCCIDKSNNTELSEALNSMYRWYKNATRCYVYLDDLQVHVGTAGSEWMGQFLQSRWFTRGWTLQELIAPQSVEFYDRAQTCLGTKASLGFVIAEKTGIPSKVLRGAPIELYRIDDRLEWAEGRQTTRGEDQAYCLLGLVGVFLPLLYGIGRDRAMNELRRQIAQSQSDDASAREPMPPSGCTREVRLGGAIWEDLLRLNDAQLRRLDRGLEQEAYWIGTQNSSEVIQSTRFAKQVRQRLVDVLKELGVQYGGAGNLDGKMMRRTLPKPGNPGIIGASGHSFRWPLKKMHERVDTLSYRNGITAVRTIRYLMIWRGIWTKE